MTDIPPYVVRESGRARHVRLVMTADRGLEVVVPRGFDQAEIPGILARKAGWIARATSRAAARRSPMPAPGTDLPDCIELSCLRAVWSVEYVAPSRGAVGPVKTVVREKPGRVLVVSGDVRDAAVCREALRRWLRRRARMTLAPRLAVMAAERGFAVGSISIRAQRTRWGSCTPRGGINLNVRLLFLPPELTDYVLLHELCHTVRGDHSPAFWALVERHDPDWRDKRRRLRDACRHVPVWFERSAT